VPALRTRPLTPFLALLVGLAATSVVGITASARASAGVAPWAADRLEAGFDDPKLAREMSGASPAPRALVRDWRLATVVPLGPGATVPVPKLLAKPVPSSLAPMPPSAPGSASAAVPRPATTPARSPADPIRAPTPSSRPVVRVAISDQNDSGAQRSRSIDIAQTHQPVTEATRPEVAASDHVWPYVPRMKLAYRRFPFARVASAVPSITPGTLDPARPESFESVSLDFYPISWYLRVGLSSQFGWESGQFDRTGDYFFAESASVGFQVPGRFTPFVEGLAGGGYMRRQQADGPLPAVFWQLGIDAGVEIYFARRAYLSLAAGYLHPANVLWIDQNLRSVKADTWSLKVGLGI